MCLSCFTETLFKVTAGRTVATESLLWPKKSKIASSTCSVWTHADSSIWKSCYLGETVWWRSFKNPGQGCGLTIMLIWKTRWRVVYFPNCWKCSPVSMKSKLRIGYSSISYLQRAWDKKITYTRQMVIYFYASTALKLHLLWAGRWWHWSNRAKTSFNNVEANYWYRLLITLRTSTNCTY